MYQKDVKGHGYFRKSKAYGLVCGIALFGAMVTTSVSAEEIVTETTPAVEVVNPNPATNLETVQETPSAENLATQAEAGQKTGELTSPVTSTELDKAVTDAKEAGVTVTEDSKAIVYDNLDQAQADLAKQAEAVKEATVKQEDNTEAIKKAEDYNAEIDRKNKEEAERIARENAEIDARNKAAQEKADKINSERKTQVIENEKARQEAMDYNKAEVERVEREYKEALAEWEKTKATTGVNDPEYIKAKAEYDKAKAEYDLKFANYLKEKAAVDAHNAQAQAEYDAIAAQIENQDVGNPSSGIQGHSFPVGEFPSEKWGNFSPMDLGNGLVAMGQGNVSSWADIADPNGSYNVLVKDTNKILDNAHIISRVEWGNVAPTGAPSLYAGDKHTEENDGINTYGKGNASQVWSVRPSEWLTIPGGVLLADGSRKDLEVKFEKFGDPTSFGKDWVVFWNEGGAINAIDGFEWNYNRPADGLRRYYRVKDSNDAYFWSYVAVDTDAGQTTRLPHALILSIGGGLTALDQGTVKSGENLGYTYGKARDDRALAGTSSAPDGVAVFAAYKAGDVIIETQNSPGGNGLAVATGDFGYSVNMKAPTFEKKDIPEPEKPTPPEPKPDDTPKPEPGTPNTKEVPPLEKFIPVTVTPEPPKKPNFLPHIPVPEKETYEAAVHPVIVKQTPANIKAVVNEDGVNVNGKLVPKGSTQTWVLTNSPLVAGREVVTSYTMLDPLPAGFEIDREATAIKNTAWTVNYDENGKTTLSATQATLDYLNANRNQDVVVPVAYFVGRPINDGGTYKNTFTTLIATPKGEYKVVSNIPVIYTPGNDPETPRPPHTPGGENPTPDDNLIKPKKDVVDEKGNSINGQSVLPNTVLNYVAEQDFDQYKGIVASQNAIGKGFLYVDDYLDEAIDGTSLVVNSITAANGDDVRELFDMIHVLSKDSLDEKLQALIQDSGISPVGEFYLWVAKDPEAFYKAYVQQGLDITRNLSFKIKQDFVGTITNQTHQVDFGNGYYGNIVTNEVPQLVVHKDVLDKDGKSINNGTVQIGDLVTYKLEGWVIPAGRGYDIKEYRFVDLLQHSHDDYQSFVIEAKVDFTLSDGTIIKKGDDLSSYTETVYNAQTGKFETRFKEAFLAQITRDQAFGADGYITVKRIASGEVVNEYTLYVNGNPVISNKVVTNTPEPPKPETPKPQAPAKVEKAQLPNTGDAASYSLSLAGVVTLFASLVGLRKRKDENN
ncbi:TPA: LPXTG cell wall anchor domain-containing protein [Streptococcus suis]|nr:LPXTG cell wall anchor domain-containing protein [Streptococcus suis]